MRQIIELLVAALMLGMSIYSFVKVGAKAGLLLAGAFISYAAGILLRSSASDDAPSLEPISLALKAVGIILLIIASAKYFSKKKATG